MTKRLILIFTLCLSISSAVKSQHNADLTIVEKVDVITTLAREPMLAEHPNGDLYVTGYANVNQSPQLWKSTDRGKKWVKLDVGTVAQGADGNSDADLVIGKDGTIYLLSMKYTRVPEDTTGFDWSSMKGEHITIGVSKDNGTSWKWTYLSQGEFDDRPWVEIASDGSIHVIWNDGKGVHYTVSTDKGTSWVRRPAIHDKGGSSHLAAGPDGRLAVRVVPISASGKKFDEGVDLLRLSLDFGQSWKEVSLPGARTWSADIYAGTPRWVEPIQWDASGNLYYFWSEGKQLKLGVSSDNGKQWSTYLVEDAEHILYYPFLSVTGNDISCTWVSGFGKDLRHNAAILNINNGQLKIAKLPAQRLTDLRSRFIADENLATGGEYFPLISLSDGNFGMVTTIQNNADNRLGFSWWRLFRRK
ncbi:MAG: sialidase family protein [Bacteroidota bacterium]